VNIWRKVDGAILQGVPLLQRRTRWWELTLECGHVTERHVRYRRLAVPQPKGTRRGRAACLGAGQLRALHPGGAAGNGRNLEYYYLTQVKTSGSLAL
jgi:hypothetical protein